MRKQIMKKQFITSAALIAGFLFAGASSASISSDLETDVIYGNSNIELSSGEAYVAGSSVQSELQTDVIYGNQELHPHVAEAADLHASNLDNTNDLIYGS